MRKIDACLYVSPDDRATLERLVADGQPLDAALHGGLLPPPHGRLGRTRLPCPIHMRCTVVCATSVSWAIIRAVQCVAFFGFSSTLSGGEPRRRCASCLAWSLPLSFGTTEIGIARPCRVVVGPRAWHECHRAPALTDDHKSLSLGVLNRSMDVGRGMFRHMQPDRIRRFAVRNAREQKVGVLCSLNPNLIRHLGAPLQLWAVRQGRLG